MKSQEWRKYFDITNLRRPLALVWESSRGWTVAGMVLMVFQALLPLVTLYLIKLTVDAVTGGIAAVDKTAALREVMILVALTGLVTLLIAACRAAAGIVELHKGQLVTDYVTDVIHRQSVAVDLAYYEDSHYHDTFYRAQREASTRPTRIVSELTGLIQNSISLVALAGLLLYLHWGITIVLFVAAIPSIVVKIRHSNRLYQWYTRRTETERRVFDYHRMLTDVVHAKEMRLFGLGDIFRERYRGLRTILRGEQLNLAKNRSKADLLAQSVTVVSLFGMVALIGWQTLQGRMTLGDMVMYQQAFQRAQSSLQGITGGLAGLYENNLFLNNFYDFLNLKPAVASPQNGEAISPPRPLRRGVNLDGVTFRYPGAEHEALRGVDLQIGPGEVVALVGDNGAGKSTMAKLLCRLYDPAAGQITIDGIDYRRIDLDKLRREITMIFQDYIQYPFSARDNIWIGDVDLDPADPRVEQAARKAGADQMIQRLSNGYETILGKRFREGAEISIGEWQKIALSRAFLRDAQLIILDEPTSAMSAKAEYEIFQAFRELLNGRSALLISHRFSTVRMADKICVMEEGRIVEEGSHEDLIREGGRYARMYEMQAGSYR
ncbi:MAG: ABC transporter ATP-binding protein [Dethiobacteria bacterium]|nr:ABC transporter ATP-binding protein [Dethiobacteria bacterium]